MMGHGAITKIVVLTRGRTGSTPITDELGRAPATWSLQEIFSAAELPSSEFPYFDRWRSNSGLNGLLTDRALASVYLQAVAGAAQKRGARALFWKALFSHFEERRHLHQLLMEEGYRGIHLLRHAARRALSGLIAQQRGVFNTDDAGYQDDTRYTIDLKTFEVEVRLSDRTEEKHRAFLRKIGMDFIEVSYDDYLRDRATFFSKIYRHFGLTDALPEASEFKVMIPDLQATIANYDEVAAAARRLGYPLDD